MRSVRYAAGAMLLAACSPTVSDAQQAAGTHRLTGDRVAVYNLAGAVVVGAGAGDAVTVEVVPHGADAGRLEAVSGELDGRASLRVIYPDDRIVYRAEGFRGRTQLRVRDDGSFGGGGNRRDDGDRVTITNDGSGLEAWADLSIRIPEGRDVAIHQAVGSIVVRNVNGELLVDASSADVEASGTRGSLTVDIGAGNVAARNVQGRLLIDTGSGDVTLEGTAGDNARIDTGSGSIRATGVRATELIIDTGSGDVMLDAVTADRLRVDTGSGAVTVGLGADVSDLTIDTGSGDVQLRAPAQLGAELHVETGSGTIESDVAIAVTRRSRNELHGTVGDGAGRILIDTGSGDVTIR